MKQLLLLRYKQIFGMKKRSVGKMNIYIVLVFIIFTVQIQPQSGNAGKFIRHDSTPN